MKLLFSTRKKLLIPLTLLEIISVIAVSYAARLLGLFTDGIINNEKLVDNYYYLIIIFAVSFFHYLNTAVSSWIVSLVALDMQKKIMSEKLKTNKNFETAWNETEKYVNDYVMYSFQVFWMFVVILSAIIVLAISSWIMALSLFLVIFMTYFVPKLFSGKIKKLNKESLKINNDLNYQISIFEKNYQTISLSNQEMQKKVQALSLRKRTIDQNIEILNSKRDVLAKIIIGLIYLTIIITSGLLIYFKETTIGTLVIAGTLVGGFISQIPYTTAMIAHIKNNKWIKDVKNIEDHQYLNTLIPNTDVKSITMQNIVKKYDDKLILNNINLNLKKPTNILLVGDNGSGKSTLSQIISGLDHHFEGKLTVNKLAQKPDYYNSPYIYQSSIQNLIKGTVRENIVAFHENYDVKHLTEIVNMLKINKLIDKKTTKLSSGEVALVKVAIILYSNAKLKIYDELLMNIDIQKRSAIFDIILKQNSINIIISHSIKTQERKRFDQILSLD